MRALEEYVLSRKVIVSRGFRTFRMADKYRELSSRLGRDFSASIALLDRLPTFMEGSEHKRVRRALAIRNEGNKQAQLRAAKSFLKDFVANELRRGKPIDLMQELALPLFRQVAISAIAAETAPVDLFEIASRVPSLFSSLTPLKERLALERDIAAVLAEAGEAVLEDLSLLALGVYPLTGSLALSLHQLFRENPATLLDEIAWPAAYPVSSLHFVDRICRKATSVEGRHFGAEERVRCAIHSDDWTEAENRDLFFGTGAHLCLGRAIAEEIWRITASEFGRLRIFAEAGELAMDPTGEPFDRPRRAMVTFHD